MPRRSIRAITVATVAFSVVCCLVAIVLSLADASVKTPPDRSLGTVAAIAPVAVALAFALIGATVARRVPSNAIGWVLLLTGLLAAADAAGYQWADRAIFVADDLPGGAAAAWLTNVASPPTFGLLALALLLFPDGRLPSRRWRPALWLAVAGSGGSALAYALAPGPFEEPFDTVSNPLGTGPFDLFDAMAGLAWLLMGVAVGASAVAMVLRLRRSRGAEREQLKWIAFAAAVAGTVIVVEVATFFAGIEGVDGPRTVAQDLAFALFPIAAGVAILRYRLYDIDLVINRALVYGTLTVALASAYVACVLLLQLALHPLTSESQIAVAASTLAVAALFGPARARIQRAVDRRFFRHRYDAARTLEAFGERLRREVDVGTVSADLRAVAIETMQPAHAGVWLREPSP